MKMALPKARKVSKIKTKWNGLGKLKYLEKETKGQVKAILSLEGQLRHMHREYDKLLKYYQKRKKQNKQDSEEIKLLEAELYWKEDPGISFKDWKHTWLKTRGLLL